MIATLKGVVVHVDKNKIIIDVAGIGYLVNTPDIFTIDHNTIVLFTHQIFKDEVISLYGFKNSEKLELFKHLIKVNGVGPKTALILLQSEPKEIITAINNNNAEFIKEHHGIGSKVAQQIIFELQKKIYYQDEYIENNNFELLRLSLNEFGYKNSDIFRIINAVDYNENLEIMIGQALKILNE